MSVYAIGDIHGGYRGLQQALLRAPLRPGDTLIFMGDYVDGWSENFETVEYILELKKKYFCICLKGNHDKWTEEWLTENFADETWLAHGGEATRQSYLSRTDAEKQRHIEFYQSLVWYYVDMQDRLFIHAGYTQKNGPEAEPDKLTLIIDRSLWTTAMEANGKSANSIFYPKRLKAFREIFIGHTPTTNFGTDKPMHASNVTNVDTGAGFFGKVTIINVDTKEYWQSDALPDLYPGEKGRNKE